MKKKLFQVKENSINSTFKGEIAKDFFKALTWKVFF